MDSVGGGYGGWQMVPWMTMANDTVDGDSG